MGIQLPGSLYEAQAYTGLRFPSTNESALRGRAGQWRQLAQLAAEALRGVDGAVQQVGGANVGDTRDAFVDFMGSGGGNTGSLRDFQQACQAAAVAHEIAAMTIMSLKMFTIAQLTVLATAINTAKAIGPEALPWLHSVMMQTRAAIITANTNATNQLRAG